MDPVHASMPSYLTLDEDATPPLQLHTSQWLPLGRDCSVEFPDGTSKPCWIASRCRAGDAYSYGLSLDPPLGWECSPV